MTKKKLKDVLYGDCVRYKGDYWLLGDSHPVRTLVRITDDHTIKFGPEDTWPKVEIITDTITICPEK